MLKNLQIPNIRWVLRVFLIGIETTKMIVDEWISH